MLEKTRYYNEQYRNKNYYIMKNGKTVYVNKEYDFTLDEIEQILRDNCLEK